MEFFDLYTSTGKPLGRKIMRGAPVPRGEYHIVVQVMTINHSGEILLTQRVPEKTSGGKWECSGGCAVAGESGKEAAIRELREETGIIADEGELTLEWTLTTDGMLRDFYVLIRDVPLCDLKLQDIEVCAAKWVSFERLCEMSKNGQTTRTVTRWLESQGSELLYIINKAKRAARR